MVRRIAMLCATIVFLPLVSAQANSAWDLAATNCLTLVRQGEFGQATDACLRAYDRASTLRINGNPRTSDDVATLVRNAQVMEAEALAEKAAGRASLAKLRYQFARIDAEGVLQSRLSDAASRATAQGVSDRSVAALKALASVQLPQAPTPAPGCERFASITNAQSADFPADARRLKLGPVAVLVQVRIDEHGQLVSSSIYRSSGNASIDAAAIKAAQGSTYAPGAHLCKPVGGDYLFRSEFNPD